MMMVYIGLLLGHPVHVSNPIGNCSTPTTFCR